MDVLGVLTVLPLLFLRSAPALQQAKSKVPPPSRSNRATRATTSVRPLQILSPRGMLIPVGDVSSAWRSSDGTIFVSHQSLDILGLRITDLEQSGAIEVAAGGIGIVRVEKEMAPGHQWDGMVRLSDIASATKSRILIDPKLPLARLQTSVSSVFADKESVRIASYLPIRPNLVRDKSSGKVIIDIPGATMNDVARPTIPDGALYKTVRVGQYQDNIARVVIESSDVDKFRLIQGESAAEWIVSATPAEALPVAVAVAPSLGAAPVIRSAALPATTAPFVTPVTRAEAVASPHGVDFIIESSRLPWFRPVIVGNQFVLDLNVDDSSAMLSDLVTKIDNTLLGTCEWKSGLGWGGRLTVTLNQPTRFMVSVDPRGRLKVSLREQVGDVAGLPLAGRTILVDPGHGGPGSTGTKGVDGRLEKQNTLPMAIATAARLDALGANVVLTRDNDVDPGLKERPAISNRVDADAFVSIHCNDAVRSSAVNGSLVFYHMDSQPCLDLATKISDRLGTEVAAIKKLGVRSDKTVYKNDGFAVLRLSSSAGVLVEAGFMSNPSDAAALAAPATQQAIGVAVANGILDFLLGNQERDTRYIKGKGNKLVMPDPNDTALPTDNPFVDRDVIKPRN
ncbi:MAG: N-acetylmuramoyl-L-alanine amidase [Armatimonadota bacterium]